MSDLLADLPQRFTASDRLQAFANQNIMHLRLSGNAPELRCYTEAATIEVAKALCDACLAKLVLL